MSSAILERTSKEITESNFKVGTVLSIMGGVSFGIWRESFMAGIFVFSTLSILAFMAVALAELTEKE